MKALNAFIKPFEAPQRNEKTKIQLIFILIQIFEMNGEVTINIKFNLYIKTTPT